MTIVFFITAVKVRHIPTNTEHISLGSCVFRNFWEAEDGLNYLISLWDDKNTYEVVASEVKKRTIVL